MRAERVPVNQGELSVEQAAQLLRARQEVSTLVKDKLALGRAQRAMIDSSVTAFMPDSDEEQPLQMRRRGGKDKKGSRRLRHQALLDEKPDTDPVGGIDAARASLAMHDERVRIPVRRDTSEPTQFLLDGKSAFFRGSEGEVTVERKGDKYKIIDQAGDDSGFVYDEEHFRSIARAEGWVAIATPASVTEAKQEAALSKEKEPAGEFRTLKKGEIQAYLSKDDVYYTIKKEGDGYYIQNDDETWSGPYTKGALSYQAKEEGWRAIEAELVASPVVPEAKEEKVTTYEFYPLQDGEKQKYFVPEIGDYTVEKLPEGYRFFLGENYDPKVDSDLFYTEKEMREIVKQGKWEVRGEVILPPENIATPDAVSEEEKGTGPTLEELQGEVDAMRFAYVTADYNETSLWKKLKGVFGSNIADEANTLDRATAKEGYEKSLIRLQEKQLEALKRSGVKGKELKEKIDALLFAFKYEERPKMDIDRMQVKIENKDLPAKILGVFEKMGREYNKLSKWQKLAIGGACAVSAVGLSFAGGAVGGVAAGAILVTRRILSSAAMGVSMDTLALDMGEGVKKWLATREAQNETALLHANEKNAEALSVEDVEQLDKILKKDISQLDKKFKNQKLEGIWRRSLAFGSGMALANAASFVDFSDSPEAAEAKSAPVERVGASVVEQPRAGDTAVSEQAEVTRGVDNQIAAKQPDIFTKGLMEDYKVTAADGKKGLWGVLEKRLDIPEGPERNRVVQSLENLMQQKLNGMSLAEQKAVGFPTGKIDMIQRGGVIQFDKLLTPQQIQEVMNGKDIGAPGAPEVKIPEVGAGEKADNLKNFQDGPNGASKDPLMKLAEEGEAKNLAARAAKVAEFDADKKFYDPKEFLLKNPELKGKLFGTIGKLRMEIFTTRETADLLEYNYIESGKPMGSTLLSQVNKDALALKDNPFTSYDRVKNPLHYSQMQELTRFMKAAQAAFGPLAQPEAGESIDKYTGRIATMAVSEGKAIKGFYKP